MSPFPSALLRTFIRASLWSLIWIHVSSSNVAKFVSMFSCSFFQFSFTPGHRTAAVDNKKLAPSWSGVLITQSVETMEAQRTLSDLPVVNLGLPQHSLLILLFYETSFCPMVDIRKSVFRLHLYPNVFVSDFLLIFHHLSSFASKAQWMSIDEHFTDLEDILCHSHHLNYL